MAAPWVAIGCLPGAADTIAAASWPRWLASWLMTALIWAGTLLLLIAWDGTVQVHWDLIPTTAPGPATGVPQRIETRSIAAVINGWRDQDGPFFPELVLGGFVALQAAIGLILAFLMWPLAHRVGSLWRSFRRALAAVLVCGLWLALLTALCGSVLVWVAVSYRLARASGDYRSDSGAGMGAVLLMMACIWLFLCLLTRAVGAVRDERPAAPPPRCEGCGYDLTHVPDTGLCSECGTEVVVSLSPTRRRPSPWERKRGVASFVTTTVRLLGSSRRFYRGLALRSREGDAATLAWVQFAAIGFSAMAWIASLVYSQTSVDDEEWLIPVMSSLGITITGWVLHRLVASIHSVFWAWGGELADFSVAAKAQWYEVGFLWWFLIFSICAATDTAQNMVDPLDPITRRFLGVPIEPILFLIGYGLLLVWWVFRYRRVYRAIRWSNY